MPEEVVTTEIVDYVKFTLSGNNTQCKVCETTAYVLGSQMKTSPYHLEWTYLTAGVVSVTRSKIRTKREFEWAVDFHIHFPRWGLPAWTYRMEFNCQYTDIKNEFQVFSLGYNKGFICLQFQCQQAAAEFCETVQKWLEEGSQPERECTQLNPPSMPKAELLISQPVKCVLTLQGTHWLTKEEVEQYKENQEDLLNNIAGLRTTGKQRKIEDFPLRYALTPLTVINHMHNSFEEEDESF